MIEDIRNHKIAYFILFLFLVGFVLTFLQVWPDVMQQKAVAIGMGFFYFFWGVIVHKVNDHINLRVVFEYLAVSVLSVSLLLLLLN